VSRRDIPPNGTVVTITCVNGDNDKLLEAGEVFKVSINFTALTANMVDPSTISRCHLYVHPYEWWQVTLKPTTGGAITIRRTLPAIYKTVEAFY